MSILLIILRTFDVLVVSCDVLQSGDAHSLGTNQRSNPLCVFVYADHLTLSQDDGVDVRVHLGVDERDVVEQVDALVLDRFDRSWATAEHSWDEQMNVLL